MTYAEFQDVKLDADTARESKRLVIRMFGRGLKVEPVDKNAGLRSLALLKKWKAATPAQEREWGMTPGSAKYISLTSAHRSGEAIDLKYQIINAKKLSKAMKAAGFAFTELSIYAYMEYVAKHYKLHLNRPNYPRISGERNHFARTSGKVMSLSRRELAQYARAIR